MTHTDGAPAAQPSFQEFSTGDARTRHLGVHALDLREPGTKATVRPVYAIGPSLTNSKTEVRERPKRSRKRLKVTTGYQRVSSYEPLALVGSRLRRWSVDRLPLTLRPEESRCR
jgi:hypothetical protein